MSQKRRKVLVTLLFLGVFWIIMGLAYIITQNQWLFIGVGATVTTLIIVGMMWFSRRNKMKEAGSPQMFVPTFQVQQSGTVECENPPCDE